MFIGVDPAKSGAAVVLNSDRRAVAGFCWTPNVRAGEEVWTVVYALCQGVSPAGPWWASRFVATTMGGIGEQIREIVRGNFCSSYHLASENAVFGRAHDTSIIVARNAGRIVGPLETLASGREAQWVVATEWRSMLLGLKPATERELAKATSKRSMPLRIPGLSDLVSLLGDADDLTDAAGVAEWLALHISRDSLPDRSRRKKKPPKPPKSSTSGPLAAKKPPSRRR